MDKITLNEWAKKHNISTLYDYDKFENREFLKRLDETKSMYPKSNNFFKFFCVVDSSIMTLSPFKRTFLFNPFFVGIYFALML